MKDKGIVVKVKNSYCIVLTEDGTYHKVPVSGSNVRVGAEIEFAPVTWLTYVKPVLMVASILILALGFSLYQMSATSHAVAYVSLDINPSIELEVDQNLKVLHVYSLNDGAEKMVSVLRLQGIDLYTSVSRIMAEAVRKGYLKPGQKNYVLSTVTVNNDAPDTFNYDVFTRNLETAVENKGIDIEIIVLSTDMPTRNKAKNQGLSPGKLMIYQNAVASGEKLTLEQVKQNSLSNLVNVHKVKLLPNNKKLIIKSVHITPLQGKDKFDGNHGPDRNDARNTIRPEKEGKGSGQNENDVGDREKEKDKEKDEYEDEDGYKNEDEYEDESEEKNKQQEKHQNQNDNKNRMTDSNQPGKPVREKETEENGLSHE